MNTLLSTIYEYANAIGFVEAAKCWVLFGAISGGTLSGFKKATEICYEKPVKYDYPALEVPIRGVYQSSRIAGHAGWGSVIGGLSAATAPISIPCYIFWKNKQLSLVKEELELKSN